MAEPQYAMLRIINFINNQMKDTLSDTLTRLRNSSRVKKAKVILLSTNSTKSITTILKREGYIEEVIEVAGHSAPSAERKMKYANVGSPSSTVQTSPGSESNSTLTYRPTELHVLLKYEGKKMRPSFSNLKSISTPGVRKYAKSKNIPQVLGGLGVIVISTSKGLMTDTEARKLNLGGELLFAIW